MRKSEFELIRDIFAPLTESDPKAFALRDDAALLDVPTGFELVVTTDMLLEGVHFQMQDPADAIGQKVLRASLSDLAGKGAAPISYVLSCAWPNALPQAWIESFVSGLASDQKQFKVHCIGGDTSASTSGLAFSLTAFGLVETGKMLLRSGARPGDDLFVSGTIGDAWLGLQILKKRLDCEDEGASGWLIGRYLRPEPRTCLGRKLVELATASLDVSDGLVADAGHLAEASKVSITLRMDDIPISQPARDLGPDLAELITGGDDYELLFTGPPGRRSEILDAAHETGVPVRRVGIVADGTGVTVVDAGGRKIDLTSTGFRHF